MALIRTDSITKHYDLEDVSVWALKGVSIKIDQGEFVAVIGPSGSGKSTLMHILGLLDAPSEGQYFFDEKNVSLLSENERAALRSDQVGFIFQQFNLLARTTAVENVMLPILYHHNKRGAHERAVRLLTEVGLKDRLEHTPNQLSGGQQQRVAIARALINDPQLIFADEPTGNLDTKSGHEIMKILDDLTKVGKTIIMVTHEQEVAAHARRIITIRDGEIVSDLINTKRP